MKRALGHIVMVVLILFLFHPAAHAFKLPDTGQTICYNTAGAVIDCANTGQDGEYSINPMDYTDDGNGTVTDNNTNLMWQKCSAGQNNDTTCSGTASTYNWYQASGIYDATYNSTSQDICGSLNTSNFGGHNDWRLPTKKELITIVDYSVSSGPTIKTSHFPNTKNSYYLSSSLDPTNSNEIWYVRFDTASAGNAWSKHSTAYVRCVRGEQTSQSFTDNHDGTVTDNRTGLLWQQDEPGTMTWNDALNYCNNLVLPSPSGYTDWRLPNVQELGSLTDDTMVMAINSVFFPNAYGAYYWSSTTLVVYRLDCAYSLPFCYSCSGYVIKTGTNYVRCVRTGQNGSLGNFVRLMHGGSPVNTYSTFHDVYAAAVDGDTIQAQAVVSTENVTFASSIAIFLTGGYDSGFTSITGLTTIGSLTISSGMVTIGNLIIM